MKIAKLKTMSPSQAQQGSRQSRNDVKRLKQSIGNLPPRSAVPCVRSKASTSREGWIAQETGRTAAARKLLAAELACDLMLDYGSVVPTLTKDGKYIRLAGLLYFVATGKKSNLERTLQAALRRPQAEELRISHRRGPRGSAMPADIYRI